MNDNELIQIMSEEIVRLEAENIMLRNQIKRCSGNRNDKRICKKCKEFAEKKSGIGICSISNKRVKAFGECEI